jgi:hypothetical protein
LLVYRVVIVGRWMCALLSVDDVWVPDLEFLVLVLLVAVCGRVWVELSSRFSDFASQGWWLGGELWAVSRCRRAAALSEVDVARDYAARVRVTCNAIGAEALFSRFPLAICESFSLSV